MSDFKEILEKGAAVDDLFSGGQQHTAFEHHKINRFNLVELLKDLVFLINKNISFIELIDLTLHAFHDSLKCKEISFFEYDYKSEEVFKREAGYRMLISSLPECLVNLRAGVPINLTRADELNQYFQSTRGKAIDEINNILISPIVIQGNVFGFLESINTMDLYEQDIDGLVLCLNLLGKIIETRLLFSKLKNELTEEQKMVGLNNNLTAQNGEAA